MFDYRGKVGAITGASSGLGKQMAEGFAQCGEVTRGRFSGSGFRKLFELTDNKRERLKLSSGFGHFLFRGRGNFLSGF